MMRNTSNHTVADEGTALLLPVSSTSASSSQSSSPSSSDSYSYSYASSSCPVNDDGRDPSVPTSLSSSYSHSHSSSSYSYSSNSSYSFDYNNASSPQWNANVPQHVDEAYDCNNAEADDEGPAPAPAPSSPAPAPSPALVAPAHHQYIHHHYRTHFVDVQKQQKYTHHKEIKLLEHGMGESDDAGDHKKHHNYNNYNSTATATATASIIGIAAAVRENDKKMRMENINKSNNYTNNNNNDCKIYLHSNIVERAFPERMLALTVTLMFEIPVLLMISGSQSTKLCNLLGRTKFQLLMGFLPLTSAVSGNVGLQASTLTTRAISHAHIVSNPSTSMVKWFLQEIGAACVLGCGMGLCLGSMALYASHNDWAFALTIALAQWLSIVTAGITGTFAPLLFSFGFRRDSGKWAGPLETAIQDLVGSLAMVIISYHLLLFLGSSHPMSANDQCSINFDTAVAAADEVSTTSTTIAPSSMFASSSSSSSWSL